MTTFKGGNKLKEIKVKADSKSVSYSVGFYEKAKYADGTQVAEVALHNEFGTRNEQGVVVIPERPFFRQANKNVKKRIKNLVIKLRDPETKILTRNGVEKIAQVHVGVIKERIRNLSEPKNAPSTVSKKGSSNPLIDTSFMFQSVTHEVEE